MNTYIVVALLVSAGALGFLVGVFTRTSKTEDAYHSGYRKGRGDRERHSL